jgi:hypothetical protein
MGLSVTVARLASPCGQVPTKRCSQARFDANFEAWSEHACGFGNPYVWAVRLPIDFGTRRGASSALPIWKCLPKDRSRFWCVFGKCGAVLTAEALARRMADRLTYRAPIMKIVRGAYSPKAGRVAHRPGLREMGRTRESR